MTVKNRRYRRIFAALGALILLVAGIGCMHVSRAIRRQLYDANTDNLNEVYTQVAGKFDQLCEFQWHMLAQTGKYLAVSDKDAGKTEDFLAEWREKWKYHDFYYFDREGGYETLSGLEGKLAGGSAWENLNAGKGEMVMEGSALGDENLFLFVRTIDPVEINGQEITALAVSFDVDSLNREMQIATFDGLGNNFIVYSDGSVALTDSGSAESGANLLESLTLTEMVKGSLSQMKEDFLSGTGGKAEFKYEGKYYYAVYVPIDGKGWLLVSFVPEDVVNKSSYAVRNSIFLMTALAFGTLSVVLIMGIGLIYQYSLSRKNREIVWRDILFSTVSQNMDDVYLMAERKTRSLVYVSPNITRVLGLSPEDAEKTFILGGRSASDEELSRLPAGGSLSYDCMITPVGKSEPRMFRKSVYHAMEGENDLYIFTLSDRTHEQEVRGRINDALHTAETANASKSLFLSNMSHDIRTPMNAIVGLSRLMQQHAEEPERVLDYTGKIIGASEHLLGLIDDVLDMSKIESGKSALRLEPLSLGNLIEQIETIIRPQTGARGQTFTVSVEEITCERVMADATRLRQILLNLLSNAVKYTPEGGKIDLMIQGLPGTSGKFERFRFVVSDNGIGMAEEYLDRVFEPFSREINSTTNTVQGTGLGLAITKNLVDMMGGVIRVQSRPGKGSRFEVTLEFRPADPLPNRKPIRLLAVGSSEEGRRRVQSTSRGSRFEVTIAPTAEDAFAAIDAAEETFSVILMKEDSEKGVPYELAEKLREYAGGGIMPVFALLSTRPAGEILSADAEAFEILLRPPFFLSALERELERFLSDAPDGTALRGLHFLCAEDNELNAEILTELLEMNGASAEICVNGRELVKRFEASRPGEFDMILMDVQMPVMNGYEAARAVRMSSHPLAGTIPILAMTANAFSDDIQNALDAGMNAHVAKPVDMTKLELLVSKLINRGG